MMAADFAAWIAAIKGILNLLKWLMQKVLIWGCRVPITDISAISENRANKTEARAIELFGKRYVERSACMIQIKGIKEDANTRHSFYGLRQIAFESPSIMGDSIELVEENGETKLLITTG